MIPTCCRLCPQVVEDPHGYVSRLITKAFFPAAEKESEASTTQSDPASAKSEYMVIGDFMAARTANGRMYLTQTGR